MDGQMDRWIGRQIDKQIDGWINLNMAEQMYRPIDKFIDIGQNIDKTEIEKLQIQKILIYRKILQMCGQK